MTMIFEREFTALVFSPNTVLYTKSTLTIFDCIFCLDRRKRMKIRCNHMFVNKRRIACLTTVLTIVLLAYLLISNKQGKFLYNIRTGGFWPHDASRTRIVTFFFSHDAYSHLFKNLATRVVKFFSQR